MDGSRGSSSTDSYRSKTEFRRRQAFLLDRWTRFMQVMMFPRTTLLGMDKPRKDSPAADTNRTTAVVAIAESSTKRLSWTLTGAFVVGTTWHGRCGWRVNHVGGRIHEVLTMIVNSITLSHNNVPPDNPPTRLMHPTSHRSTRLGTTDCVVEQDGTQRTPRNMTIRC